MSDSNPELTSEAELAPFADSLRALNPHRGGVDRDAIMFAAGQASLSRWPRWMWPAVSGALAVLALVFGGLLAFREPVIVERIVVQKVVVPAPEVQVESPTAPPGRSSSPSQPNSTARFDAADVDLQDPKATAELRRMTHLREEVFRWGIDMLPEARPAPIPKEQSADDSDRLFRLPEGTFTSPYGFHLPASQRP